MAGANAARGEVLHRLAGSERCLCLTLGALAEMEAALQLVGSDALSLRLRSLSAGDLIAVLAALLRGGGETEFAAHVSTAAINPREAAEAVARAFEAAAG